MATYTFQAIQSPRGVSDIAWNNASGDMFDMPGEFTASDEVSIKRAYRYLRQHAETYITREELAKYARCSRFDTGRYRNALERLAFANGWTLTHAPGIGGGWTFTTDPAAIATMDHHYSQVIKGVTKSWDRSKAAR